MKDPDLIVVGGGVAGGALATVAAGAGASALVLERPTREDVSAVLGGAEGSINISHPAVCAALFRQRLANLGVALEVWANDGFSAQGPELRASRYEHIANDDALAALERGSFASGLDSVPQDLGRAELVARLDTHHQ
jgi:choline dehydrogenase-like flavoprotein